MKIYDISMEIKRDIAVWKDKDSKKPRFMITAEFAYFHMIDSGKRIGEISLDKFIGNCIVLDFTRVNDKITNKELEKMGNKIKKNDIVLLKTLKKPMKKFDFNFAYLGKTGAKFLADKGIKMVGIDALGIERGQSGHDTHKILFEKNIPVVEGLELSKINSGRYFFIGLPLKIKEGDASPIRAVLVK